MKYAREVIDLMGAMPGREFRMAEIIRHVSRARVLPAREREAMRKGVLRVLNHLCASGQVERDSDVEKSAYYSWKCPRLGHGGAPIWDRSCDNSAGRLRL